MRGSAELARAALGIACAAVLASGCSNATGNQVPESIATVAEAPQATGGELAGTLVGPPPSTGHGVVVPATSALIRVPFGGQPCQAIPIADFGKLKMSATGLDVTLVRSPKRVGQSTDPAGAAGVGCTWNLDRSNGQRAGSVTVAFESVTAFQRHRAAIVAQTPRPIGLPAGSFDNGGQLEATKNGYSFTVTTAGDPWAREESAIAAAVLARL